MEEDIKVFSSNITRGLRGDKNDLYELLNIQPATPIKLNEVEKSHCTFQPKSDKYYEYKKKSKIKVKTVRELRNSFEKDIDTDVNLAQSLEKQRNILLKIIRDGCSKDKNTKKLAINMLNSDNPILRSTWQMLANINPKEHAHSLQYILWNGKNIRVCGSKGGINKYIYKNELPKSRDHLKNKKSFKRSVVNKKKCLLQDSLSIKIKPGPLTQKKYIDDSYQKHHVGNLELINLPKPGLDVMPVYGSCMEPTITNFLHSLRDVDGIISHKWAEFAVSMVGTLNKSYPVQLHKNTSTTFDLNYKYNQKKMLMRRDIENTCKKKCDKNETIILSVNEGDIVEVVEKVVDEMIDSVEISLDQDKMYTGEDEQITISEDLCSINSNNNNVKEKNKKKYCELGRLDVTVIRLPENSENTESNSKVCTNSYCALGCICESLNCPVVVKGHCGRLECMFQCKCDFSSYKDLNNYDSVSSDLIPGLIKLDKEMNSKLSKEEQKFHQTVVLTGDKSIILKSHRRNWKASAKYSDFYKNMSLKVNTKIERDLIIVDKKINCDNIEPWCMVHNLYKCFCKGRFVHSVAQTEAKHFEVPVSEEVDSKKINLEPSIQSNQSKTVKQHVYKQYQRKDLRKNDNLLSEISSITIDLDGPVQSDIGHRDMTCARLQVYVGRKYSKRYYRLMNQKIREMEKDDLSLHKKLKSLVSIDEIDINDTSDVEISKRKETFPTKHCNKNKIIDLKEKDLSSHKRKKTSFNFGTYNIIETNNVATVSEQITQPSREDTPELSAYHIRENFLSGGFSTTDVHDSNKGKLVAWLEYSYKQYKMRCDQGMQKITLQAPQPKKMALLPWNFILERYKERKNYFLVTKQKPFRMFMAVNHDHPFLQDCTNIDDIRFVDLYNYPATIKKLITNATDLKDSFCILCGHACCWELIGSVTKVDEPNNETNLKSVDPISNDKSTDYNYNENSCTESESISSTPSTDEDEDKVNQPPIAIEPDINTELNSLQSESSKWFVMTVEKDFSEIQFFHRGFFVKYESIIKAINIARYSRKTVRLSSQKCAENSSNSQFGVYAIPNANEDCVFIGPYECNESLGIETIRTSILYTTSLKRTRGHWITTNKIDNLNVIDNPMSFMTTKDVMPNDFLSLRTNPNEKKDSFSSFIEEPDNESSNSSSKDKSTLVKSVKVLRPQSLYSSSPKSLLRPISAQKQQEPHQFVQNYENKVSDSESTMLTTSTMTSVSLTNLLSKLSAEASEIIEESISPPNPDDSTLTRIDPDIREVGTPILKKNTVSKTECGMFAILKPEEINKKIMINNIFANIDDSVTIEKEKDCNSSNIIDPEIEKDIDTFLTNELSSVQDCSENIFVISDDEECTNKKSTEDISNVWIECKRINNFGWLSGRRHNKNKLLSFEFPGFKYSKFYHQNVVFKKINRLLSRRICIPFNLKMEWHIVDHKSDLKAKKKLQSRDLGKEFILTKQGLTLKSNLVWTSMKTYSRKENAAIETEQDNELNEKLE